jgi:HlyB family type I secretion system ABC transporter
MTSEITQVQSESDCPSWMQRAKARFHRRVPVIMQLSAAECGAACLAMVLSYYGRKTRSSECRDAIGIGRDGVSAKTLAQLARSYGLRVRAYSIDELQNLQFVQFPAIAHWRFSHFVVIESWSPKRIVIVDPAQGRRRITPEELDANFTGVVLTFEPGPQFKRRSSAMHLNSEAASWRTYFLGMMQSPGIIRFLLQVLIASLVLQLLGLALPLVTKIIFDNILPYEMVNGLQILGIGVLILILTQFILQYLRAALLIYLQARLDSQLMLGFFEHVLSLPFRFFQQRTSGDLLMRLSSNAAIRETLTSQSISIVLDGALVVVYVVVLLLEQATFGMVVIGLGILQMGIMLATTRRVNALMENDLAAQSESQSYLVEALGGIAILKASGNEHQALDHWTNLFFKQLNISLKRSQLMALTNTLLGTLRNFSPLLLMWYGAQFVLNGEMSLGTLLALNALAVAFLTPLASLVSTAQQLQLVGAHLNRITDVIQEKPDQDATQVMAAPTLKGHIKVDKLSFRYDPHAPWTLHDISVEIKPGQKIALVGPTGSGKSTLAMLLLGLYEPTEGQILYDGLDLLQLEYRSLRRQIGIVLQESFLFSSSIRRNIAFNDPDMGMERVIEAAELACIHPEIAQLPLGYETQLAEGGAGLSGGQRQRLALARALAGQPRVLILDEATSHLDAETERRVDQRLRELDCTRIIIAHRLSTVREADLILVMYEGRIVERGTHQALLDKGGFYAALVQGQIEGSESKSFDTLPL